MICSFKRIKQLLSIRRAGYKTIQAQYICPLDKTKYAKLGHGSIVAANSHVVPENMEVEDYCVIQDRLNFISDKGKLYVKKYSVISSNVTIVPASHKLTVGVPFYLSTVLHINDQAGDVIIDEDCWIGTGAIILNNRHIGRGAVVAAGSVVTKDIPPYAVVAGVPAQIIATKFTEQQIIAHEKKIYPENERFSIGFIGNLFRNNYKGLPAIGTENISADEKEKLEFAITNMNLNTGNK